MHKIKEDIYFPIGFGFEDVWLDKFANQNKDMKFVDMTKGIKRIMMKKHNHHGDEHEEHDEHEAHDEHEDEVTYKEDPHT